MILNSVLIIDDNEGDQFLTKMKIEENYPNVTILQAYDGEEALEILDNIVKPDQQPDLIFLDINMPGMDGLEFLKCYSERPEQKTVIAMITSSDQISDKETAMSYEFVKQYFIKPLDNSDLEVIDNL